MIKYVVCLVSVTDECGRFHMNMSKMNEAYAIILVKKESLSLRPFRPEGDTSKRSNVFP